MSKPSKYSVKSTFVLRRGSKPEFYKLIDEQCDSTVKEYNVWGVLVNLHDKNQRYNVAVDGYDIRSGPLRQRGGRKIPVRLAFVDDDGNYYKPKDLSFVDMASAFCKTGRDQFSAEELPVIEEAVRRKIEESSPAFV